MKNRGLCAFIKQGNNGYFESRLFREISYETAVYPLSKQLADATIRVISVTVYQLPAISPRNVKNTFFFTYLKIYNIKGRFYP